jgi:predicted secreted Zn-dependent protease
MLVGSMRSVLLNKNVATASSASDAKRTIQMKQTLFAVAGAIALCLCTSTANASPTIGQTTGLKTAADGAGVVEQVDWRNRGYHRHNGHYRHYGYDHNRR